MSTQTGTYLMVDPRNSAKVVHGACCINGNIWHQLQTQV